jgi:hypothetical protein
MNAIHYAVRNMKYGIRNFVLRNLVPMERPVDRVLWLAPNP